MPLNRESNDQKEKKCSRCQKRLQPGESYSHLQKGVCEQCYLDICMPKVRKTHWQYIRSIKTQYLIPGKAEARCNIRPNAPAADGNRATALKKESR